MQEIISTLISPTLYIFIVVQLINVIISTLKSIITVQGSKKSAALINAISYSIFAVITKLLTEQSFTVAVLVTFLTNLIGVWLAKYIIEKLKPEKLWTCNATIRSTTTKDKIENTLKKRNIQYLILPAENDRFLFSIFCYSKAESALVEEILNNVKTKYHIVVSRDSF